MTQNTPAQQNELLRYARLFWRHKWTVVVPAVVLPLVVAIVSMQIPDRFRSTTLILVQPQKVPDRFIPSTVTTDIEDRLRTISQQIFSRTRLEKVIQEFDLFAEEREKQMTPEEIVALMRRRIDLNVHRRDSFRLSYEDSDPRRAMLVTNKLAGLFIEENLKVREQQALGTSQFLAGEIERYRAQIREKDEAITAFKRRYLPELPEQLASNQARLTQLQNRLQINAENLNGAEDRRLQLQQQIAEIERRVEAEYQARLAERERLLSAVPADDGSVAPGVPAVVAQLPEERALAEAQAQLDQLRLSYTEKHPDVARLKAEVDRLRAEAERARRAAPVAVAPAESGTGTGVAGGTETLPPVRKLYPEIYNTLKMDLARVEADIERLRRSNREIEREIEVYQARIAVTPTRQMELQRLSEDYDNLRAILQDLVNKKMQADLSGNLEKKQKGEQFKVLDPANLPERPVAPNRLRLVLAAAFVGLALGAGLVFVADFLVPGAKSREDLKAFLPVPVLAAISEIVPP